MEIYQVTDLGLHKAVSYYVRITNYFITHTERFFPFSGMYKNSPAAPDTYFRNRHIIQIISHGLPLICVQHTFGFFSPATFLATVFLGEDAETAFLGSFLGFSVLVGLED